MRTAPTAATVALIALALAGCTGTNAETPSAPSTASESTQDESTTTDSGTGIPDPCALLDPTVIESITGYPVGEGYADPKRQKEYSSLCEWTQTDDLGTVTIALAPGYPVPYKEGEKTALGTTVKIDIPGAEEAYSVSDGLSVGMSVDGTYVAVAFSGAFDGKRGDVTIALATEVAARLG
jgi:hypothetical protein